MTPRFILDFPLDADAAGPRRPLCFGAPREVLCAEKSEQVRAVLRAAEARAREGAWVVGYVSYDAAPAFDAAFTVPGRAELPLAWFGVFDAPLPLPTTPLPNQQSPSTGPWQPSIDRERFNADIARLRQHIYAGDAYQINYTLRLHADCAGDGDEDEGADLAWFAQLRHAQPGGYCAYLDLGRQRILSASPELFFRRDGDVITTRPMKGTARRGRWSAEDRQLADWLRNSEKNRAENLMIVDLLRNDLSRLALPHSVSVSDMFAIERHPTVWQMTSTVSARARPHTALDEIFAALFPCGSVTGAPKAKAMELIAQLETEPRGIYCGAIGLIRPGGDAMFNVAIRTVTINHVDVAMVATAAVANADATCGIGGGITWDSTASDEYAEAMIKARFLDAAASVAAHDFSLFETLSLENGEYWLLQRHLDRLAASADYFGYPFDAAACRRQLATLAQQQGRNALKRVRLTLAPTGAIEASATDLPAPHSPAQPGFALAASPIPRDAIWLYHKTTQRDWYEQAYQQALATQPDIFDVLLWNDEQQLTEFTRGNLVLEIGGVRYTPPLHCGLLDGTLRRELLDSGKLQERVLTRDDLANAERILFINSLRGEIELHMA